MHLKSEKEDILLRDREIIKKLNEYIVMNLDPVEIHKSHRKEWKSKRHFEELIDEMGIYMPSEWVTRDYGIDAIVELNSPIVNSESLSPDGKFFTIQLKSTDNIKKRLQHIAFSVPVKKIIQWHSFNLAVAFVLNDLSDGTFYYLWIDDFLISSLDSKNENWVSQKTVTLQIPFENILKKENKNIIRDYVFNWKPSSRKVIQPGVYFNLKNRCSDLLSVYKEFVNPFKLESVNFSIKELNRQLEEAIYRIAITGPSRVGKSTLINALLKRKGVSPTGFFQTTGVPIQVLPSKTDEVKIIFKGGKSITQKLTTEIIKEYASQDENEDNNKNVVLVVVYLSNKQLEYGLSLFDIPGLDDPDDNIYNYTWSTVTKANAILYLIDGSPAENGGFIFKKEYKSHITDLGQSLDKIFLVFNKVNALTGNKLNLLKERVDKDLKKLDLYDKVADKIYYISAEESLKIRTEKAKGNDSVKQLETDIWDYLLSENKIGLIQLHNVSKEIFHSTQKLQELLNTRLIDNDKRKELENAIVKAKNSISKIGALYNQNKNEIKKRITKSLDNKKNDILLHLETELKSIDINQKIPNKKSIRDYLTQEAHKTIESTNSEYRYQLSILKQTIDNWVEDNLKEVRKIIIQDTKKKIIDLSDVGDIDFPDNGLIPSLGVGFLTGIIGLFINPPAAILTAITGFFGSFIFSAKERRAKQISHIIDKSRIQYNKLFSKINDAYISSIDEVSKKITNRTENKVNVYFKDLRGQIKKLEAPILKGEEELYKDAFSKIKELQISINKLNSEIESWYKTI